MEDSSRKGGLRWGSGQNCDETGFGVPNVELLGFEWRIPQEKVVCVGELGQIAMKLGLVFQMWNFWCLSGGFLKKRWFVSGNWAKLR